MVLNLTMEINIKNKLYQLSRRDLSLLMKMTDECNHHSTLDDIISGCEKKGLDTMELPLNVDQKKDKQCFDVN